MHEMIEIKELLESVKYEEILKEISNNLGHIYFEGFKATADTYHMLKNSKNEPVNKAISDKYITDLFLVWANKEDMVAALKSENMSAYAYKNGLMIYKLYTKTERAYDITDKYVKNLTDFSRCKVKLDPELTRVESAALLVLCFSVLSSHLKEVYGNLSSLIIFIVYWRAQGKIFMTKTP